MQWNRILIPIDFGPTSATALTIGLDMGRRLDAAVHLLHVVDGGGGVREFLSPASSDEDARRQLGEFVGASHRSDQQPIYATRAGAPADEILDYATEHRIDLIVMGTHGREGVARAMLGSVAETIVRKANCPVLTIRTPPAETVEYGATICFGDSPS
jgi:nucleotide-binding universal stress UspA family protein